MNIYTYLYMPLSHSGFMGVREFTQRVSTTRVSTSMINPRLTKEQKKELLDLECMAKDLRKVNFILDSLLFNGAYSEKNLEQRINNMNKIDVPEWEKEIVCKTNSCLRKLSHKTLRDLSKFIDSLNKNYCLEIYVSGCNE